MKTHFKLSEFTILLITVALLLLQFFIFTHSARANNLPSHAVVLQYHHVDTTTPQSTSISPEHFEAHLSLIESEGFNVKPLPWILDKLKSNQPLPAKTVAITFDDGYLSIYQNAFPLLKKRNYPFTVFISPKPLDDKWGESLTWDQVREMQSAGATIANHSYDHLHMLDRLHNESDEQWEKRVSDNIVHAQKRLKEELGEIEQILAYPYGEYNQALKTLVKSLGYIAFGQHSGPIGETSDFLALPRYPAAGIYSNINTIKTKLYTLPFTIEETLTKRSHVKKQTSAPLLSLAIKGSSDFYARQIQCYFMGSPIPTTVEKGDNIPKHLMQSKNIIHIRAQSEVALPMGRSRYNCTAPSKQSPYYYWYSQPWLTFENP